MDLYRVLEGHDLVLADFEDLDPVLQQPTADLVAPVERSYSASGANHNQGKWVCWHFDFFEDTTWYAAVLAQFGLDAADNTDVTIYTRDERGGWELFEGIAHLPEATVDIKQSNYFLRDVDLYITDLVRL